jgi:O-antigen/teichoic acid export membrane protein
VLPGFQRTVLRIAKGSGAGIAALVLQQGLRFAAAPFILAFLGLPLFGFWSLCFAILGFAGLHRMGFSGPAVAYVGRELAGGTPAQINRILTTSASLAVLYSLILGTAFFALAPTIVGALSSEPSVVAAGVPVLRALMVLTLLALILGGYQSALEALQEHPLLRLLDTIFAVLEAVLLYVGLSSGLGLMALVGAHAVRILGPIPFFALLARRRIPGLCALPLRVHRPLVRDLLVVGGSMQLMGMVHLTLGSVDRLALGHFAGLPAAGAYEIPKKLLNLASAIPSQLLLTLAPAAARHSTDGDSEQLRVALLRWSTRILSFLAAVPLALFLVCGRTTMYAWMGVADPDLYIVLSVLAMGSWLHLLTGPSTSILRGLAEPMAELQYALVWLALIVAVVPFSAARGGLVGAAIAYGVLQGATALLFSVWQWSRLGASRAQFFADAFLPLLLVVPGALVSYGTLGDPGASMARSMGAFHVVRATLVIGLSSLLLLAIVTMRSRYRESVLQCARSMFVWSRRGAPAP